MSFMFKGCSKLTNLDLQNFITRNVVDMSHMFNGCSRLTNLNLSNFNICKEPRMDNFVTGCINIRNLTLWKNKNNKEKFITKIKESGLDLNKITIN